VPHQLTQYDYELPDIEAWISGDSRTLAFQVVDADGDGVDISGASVSWAMYRRAYEDDPANAVLTGSDSGVELVTDNRVNSAEGDWEVRINPSATEADIYGQYFHRPSVEQSDGSRASWRGRIVLTA
jgi:hypothetical protein